MSDADEQAYFDIYWNLRRQRTWKATLMQSEKDRPCPEHWGDGYKEHAREAWMARASLHVSHADMEPEKR